MAVPAERLPPATLRGLMSSHSAAQQHTQVRIATIRRLIHDQPALAVRVIRQWLASDEPHTVVNTKESGAEASGPRPLPPASTRLGK